MAETITSLEDLGTAAVAVAAQPAAPVHVQKLDKQGRAYATGKRKNAIARVWIKPGNGKITVNGKEFNLFFARPVLQMILQQPIVAAADQDLALARLDPHLGDGVLALAGGVGAALGVELLLVDSCFGRGGGRLAQRLAEVLERLDVVGHGQALRAFLRFRAATSSASGCCAAWGCPAPA